MKGERSNTVRLFLFSFCQKGVGVTGIERLLDYGMAGILMAVILSYSTWVLTRVVPRKEAEHLADLKQLHADCEEKMERLADNFRAGIERQASSFSDAQRSVADEFRAFNIALRELLNQRKL